jgi:hypothetical protein
MTQNPAAMPLNEREAQFTSYRNVYEWTLATLSKRTLSSESAQEFVRDETPTGVDHVLLRLADTALSTFIKVHAQDDTAFGTRANQLLRDIEDIDRKAQRIKEGWLAVARDTP